MSRNQDNDNPLRNRAETLVDSRPEGRTETDPEQADLLQHELQVHQIELELQNEELRKTQAALEEHRARYMDLYHNAPVGYIVLNPAGIITEANATFARMVGMESDALRGRAFAAFLPKEEQAIFRARLRTFFKKPSDKHITVRLLAQGGNREPIFVDLAAAFSKPRAGLLPGEDELLVTVTDVTVRVKYEQALARSRNFTLAILNALEAHVCVLDDRGTIIMVNEAWRRFSLENPPVSPSTGEGSNYLEVCERVTGEEEEQARDFAAGIRAVLRGEVPIFTMEYPCHGNTQQRWFIGKVTPLLDDGNLKQAVVAHENITTRKRLEQEQLRLQSQINHLTRADSLSRMAGAIAHNFNNILAAILGNLEMAIDMVPHAATSGPARLLNEALQATWKATEISGLMLAYLGHAPGKKEEVNLTQIGQRVLHQLMRAKPANVTLATDFALPGPTLQANAKQVEQIISNLVANAWESMEDRGGKVEVTIDTCPAGAIPERSRFPLDFQVAENRGYARLTVRDEGCGIPQADIDRLFDPFFSTKFAGRGMGLAVILGILRAHQGAVTVDSRPGQGSTFRVFLPLPGADETGSPEPATW